MVSAAGYLGVGSDPATVLTAKAVVIGVATLLTYFCKTHLLRRKSRLIDQRWRALSAEAAHLREARNASWQGSVTQQQG